MFLRIVSPLPIADGPVMFSEGCVSAGLRVLLLTLLEPVSWTGAFAKSYDRARVESVERLPASCYGPWLGGLPVEMILLGPPR